MWVMAILSAHTYVVQDCVYAKVQDRGGGWYLPTAQQLPALNKTLPFRTSAVSFASFLQGKKNLIMAENQAAKEGGSDTSKNFRRCGRKWGGGGGRESVVLFYDIALSSSSSRWVFSHRTLRACVVGFVCPGLTYHIRKIDDDANCLSANFLLPPPSFYGAP